MTVRINCWSGPRNISTALMYSFRQRPDTTVVDEPLYAHYLRVSGRIHPGRDDVLRTQNPNGETVIANQILGDFDTPVVFFKQMAHHLEGLDRTFLGQCRNILLTRHPAEMIASFAVNVPDVTLADTGLTQLVELLDAILDGGNEPVVIDSRALLDDPPRVLAEVCRRIGIGFDEAMLSWPAGTKPEDGSWGEHWYHNVRQSTGFSPRAAKDVVLPKELEPVLAHALPLYERLAKHAVVQFPHA